MENKWKFICVSLLLFNITRMTFIILTAYIALYIVERDGLESPMLFTSYGESGNGEYYFGFDTNATNDSNTTTNVIGSSYNSESGFVYEEEFMADNGSATIQQIEWQSSPDITDPLFLTVTILEIITMLIITCFIMGPLTKKVPLREWLSSMAWFRIAWKRLLYLVVAIAYVHVYLTYRKMRYEESYGNPKYKNSTLQRAAMWVTVVEYITLGLGEISAKLFTLEMIKAKLLATKKEFGNAWGNVAITVYLTGVLASAIRNLVICLYFAFTAVFIIQNEQDVISSGWDVSLFTVVVVLQTGIVLIRGKYGNFFLYLCLGFFLNEGEQFTKNLSEVDKDEIEMETV